MVTTIAKSSMAITCTSVRPVSTAELMRRYDTAPVARWREFMDSLEATGRRHWASICTVSPRRTTGSHATKKTTKKHHTCRPFCWPWQCAGKIPSASPDGGGPGLLRKPLVAATGRVLWWIGAIGHAETGFSPSFFIVDPLKRGLG